jgi:hypothetical protein
MTSDWVQHVRQYSHENDVSYKEALKLAGPSYRAQKGGDLKSMLRKTKNTFNKVEKVAQKANKRADVIGRKAKNTIETVSRKGMNTGRKLSQYANEALPAVTAMNPELGLALYAANEGLKEVVGSGSKKGRTLGTKSGGSFKTSGAKSGGSFKTSGAGVGGCHQCGGHVGRSNKVDKSNMVLPPKSYAKRLREN